MSKGIGYVKLWRSIESWQWYSDVPVRTLFLHLLVKVNYMPKPWKTVNLIPGQYITSTITLAKEMGTSRASIHRSLAKLRSSGEVDVLTNNHWTLITIVNWEKWQGSDETSERPTRHQRTTSGQPAGTTKEGKKERREEENTPPAAVELVWPKWAGEQTKAKWADFLAYKHAQFRFRYKSRKTEQEAIDMLGQWFANGKDCVAALTEAMAKGYKFPVKPEPGRVELQPQQSPTLKPWVN